MFAEASLFFARPWGRTPAPRCSDGLNSGLLLVALSQQIRQHQRHTVVPGYSTPPIPRDIRRLPGYYPGREFPDSASPLGRRTSKGVLVRVFTAVVVTLYALMHSALPAGAYTETAGTEAGEESIPEISQTVELPISARFPILLTWCSDARAPGISGGATGTVRLSRRLGVGVSIRSWGAQCSPEECDILASECWVVHQTYAIANLAHVEVCPLGTHRVFVTAGGGVSFVREQHGSRYMIRERRSWLGTLMIGIGWDLRLGNHVYLSPLMEYLRVFRDEGAACTTKADRLSAGLAFTIR